MWVGFESQPTRDSLADGQPFLVTMGDRAKTLGMIGNGNEVQRPGELHDFATDVLQWLTLGEAIGVLNRQRGAEETGIKALCGMNVQFAPVQIT